MTAARCFYRLFRNEYCRFNFFLDNLLSMRVCGEGVEEGGKISKFEYSKSRAQVMQVQYNTSEGYYT